MSIFGKRPEAAKATDPVCGVVVVESLAVGPEESAVGAVWFCSAGCQARYRATTPAPPEGVEA